MGAKGLRKGEPMSIILKGIDLDEITAGNGYARLEIEEDGTVVDDISDIIIAQAIQIDRPHGRLIDEDKFIKSNECCGWIEDMTVETFNKLTPTILEAEE